MTSTVRNSIIVFLTFIVAFTSEAQLLKKKDRLYESKLRVVKYGPFLGVEFGKYTNFNFGVERQWHQIKLVKPQTHAVNLQFDYNFKQRIMGAELGYWFKPSRFDLTYGARISWVTDYSYNRFGISPNVGYKILQAHLQVGVHLLTPDKNFKNTNTFYASIRYVFISNRDLKRKKRS